MTNHTELRDRIRRAVYERLAHGPSAPDVLDPITDAAMSVIAPERDEARARLAEAERRMRAALHCLIQGGQSDTARRRWATQALTDGLDRCSSCAFPVTLGHADWCRATDAAPSPPPLVDRVQVYYCDDTHSEVIEAPRAQSYPSEDVVTPELERLRAAATEVRRHWLSQWPSGRHAVRDVSPPLHDAIDTLAARSQAAADRTCTRPLVDRVQVFYDNDQTSDVIEAPRAQTHPTEETR